MFKINRNSIFLGPLYFIAWAPIVGASLEVGPPGACTGPGTGSVDRAGPLEWEACWVLWLPRRFLLPWLAAATLGHAGLASAQLVFTVNLTRESVLSGEKLLDITPNTAFRLGDRVRIEIAFDADPELIIAARDLFVLLPVPRGHFAERRRLPRLRYQLARRRIQSGGCQRRQLRILEQSGGRTAPEQRHGDRLFRCRPARPRPQRTAIANCRAGAARESFGRLPRRYRGSPSGHRLGTCRGANRSAPTARDLRPGRVRPGSAAVL